MTGSLIASRCSAAYRVCKTVLEKDRSPFQATFTSKDENLQGNFFQGYRYALMERDNFRTKIRNSGVLRANLIDDWMATGGGSCGAKLVELDTILSEVPQTSRYNLNLIISEIAADPEVEPACPLNTLLALNLLRQLDKKYRKVLSITFISNSQLMLHSGDMSLEYKRSNELLAKHFVTERQMNLKGRLRLIDLIGRQDSRFSVIGFASTLVKPRAVDNLDALPALAQDARRQLWFKASDMFDNTITQDNMPLRGGELIIVIPPATYAAIRQEDLFNNPHFQVVEDLFNNPHSQVVEGNDEKQNEIYAIYRGILRPDYVGDFFDYIGDTMENVCHDACTDNPQTLLGRKFAEFYDLTYGRRPDYNNLLPQGVTQPKKPQDEPSQVKLPRGNKCKFRCVLMALRNLINKR